MWYYLSLSLVLTFQVVKSEELSNKNETLMEDIAESKNQSFNLNSTFELQRITQPSAQTQNIERSLTSPKLNFSSEKTNLDFRPSPHLETYYEFNKVPVAPALSEAKHFSTFNFGESPIQWPEHTFTTEQSWTSRIKFPTTSTATSPTAAVPTSKDRPYPFYNDKEKSFIGKSYSVPTKTDSFFSTPLDQLPTIDEWNKFLNYQKKKQTIQKNQFDFTAPVPTYGTSAGGSQKGFSYGSINSQSTYGTSAGGSQKSYGFGTENSPSTYGTSAGGLPSYGSSVGGVHGTSAGGVPSYGSPVGGGQKNFGFGIDSSSVHGTSAGEVPSYGSTVGGGQKNFGFGIDSSSVHDASAGGGQKNSYDYGAIEKPPSQDLQKKNPWKKIIKFLTAFIPIGLLISALTPTVISVQSVNGTYRSRAADSNIRSTNNKIISSLNYFNSIGCEDRILCELVLSAGTTQNAEHHVENLLNTFTKGGEAVEKAEEMRKILEAVKKQDCRPIICKEIKEKT